MTQTVLLGDLVSHFKGLAFKSKDYRPTGIPIVKVSNFTDNSIDTARLEHIPESVAASSSNVRLKSGDIVIATVGSWPSNPASVVGKTIKVPRSADGALLNQNAVALRHKSGDPVEQQYIYYCLKSSNFIDYLVGGAQGSANQASITLSSIFRYRINGYDYVTKKNIVDTLSSIDEKIELNRQMNETLEQMGQVLFRHYFITNPEAEKWGMIALGNKIKPRRGKSLQSKNMQPGDVPVVSGGLQPAGLHNESNTTAPVITISASGANAGFTALWGQDVWSADSSLIDTTITPHIYFYYLFLARNQKRIYEMQTGSGQPHIYPSHIELLELPNAPDQLIAEFNDRIAASFEKIEQNKQETQTLTTLRDTLLPRLINGKLKI